ncbi:MAG: TldD/PmbA family protein [Candidatus Heimdallarchaeota archaeon]
MRVEDVPKYAVKSALRSGADDVIVSSSKSISRQIKFVNNDIETTKSWRNTSADIFLVKDKRIVVANLKELNEKQIDKVISKLIRLTSILPENQEYNGIARKKGTYKEILHGYDPAVARLSEEKAISLVKRAINAALERGAKRSTGILEFGESITYISTSANNSAHEKDTSISLSIRAFAAKDASGHKISSGRTLASLKPEWAGRQAAKIAVLAKNPKQIKPGKYDIVFEPLALADLLGVAAGAASIYSKEIGMSFFKEIGDKVASDVVTLIDSGKMPGGFDSAKFDDEAVPTKETRIIEKGRFKNFLHNYSTARKYKTQTTANAGLESPSPWNTILLSGRSSREKMFKSIKKQGLFVTNVWYTTFSNFVTGDFSTIPRDGVFLIENGKIKHAVKDIRIADNMINVLKSISKVGCANEREQVHSWAAEPPSVGNNIYTPPVLCKQLNITKSLK